MVMGIRWTAFASIAFNLLKRGLVWSVVPFICRPSCCFNRGIIQIRGGCGSSTAGISTRSNSHSLERRRFLFGNTAKVVTGRHYFNPTNIDVDDDGNDVIETSRLDFVTWAKANVRYLNIYDDNTVDDDDSSSSSSSSSSSFWEAVDSIISESRVVAISEGCHNSKEQLQWQKYLVEHLVKHHNFSIVVSESGLPESKRISEYILQDHTRNKNSNSDEHNDIDVIYRKGLNRMYSEWVEGRNLIEWMREYNQNQYLIMQQESSLSSLPLLRYYGIDIGGFYHDWKSPIETNILRYLKRNVDTASEAFRIVDLTKRWDHILLDLQSNARIYFTDHMTTSKRNELTILLHDTLQILDELESELISKSGKEEYEWARQSIISMQFADKYYRNYMDRRISGSNNSHNNRNKDIIKFSNGLNGREIAMYHNIRWVLEQNPPSARVIWINHVVHTKTETQHQGEMWGWLTPAGAMLQQSIGQDKLCCIGLVYGGGDYWKDWQQGAKKRTVETVPDPKATGLEETLRSICAKENNYDEDEDMPKLCFIPWSKASKCCWPWLQSLTSIRENDYFLQIRPIEWDACVYIGRVNPATPVINKQDDC